MSAEQQVAGADEGFPTLEGGLAQVGVQPCHVGGVSVGELDLEGGLDDGGRGIGPDAEELGGLVASALAAQLGVAHGLTEAGVLGAGGGAGARAHDERQDEGERGGTGGALELETALTLLADEREREQLLVGGITLGLGEEPVVLGLELGELGLGVDGVGGLAGGGQITRVAGREECDQEHQHAHGESLMVAAADREGWAEGQ
jgi:hypothetical protein